MASSSTKLTARQRAIKARFVKERGSWNPLWDQLLDWDPDFFEAYANFSSVPWRRRVLAPKVKELIYIAIDASATHLYAPGLRRHIRNALALGAKRAEILEVLELVSVLGIHACNLGVPILAEELQAARAPARSRKSSTRSARR